MSYIKKLNVYSLLACFILSLPACSTELTNSSQAAISNLQLGMAYLQEDQYPRAKTKLLLAQQEAPRLADSWSAMAYYEMLTGNQQQAAYDYHYALRLAPNSGAIHNDYGVFLCRSGQYSLAIKQFLRAGSEDEYIDTAKAYENAGLCALKIPDPQLAKIYFEKAIQEDPQLPKSLLH